MDTETVVLLVAAGGTSLACLAYCARRRARSVPILELPVVESGYVPVPSSEGPADRTRVKNASGPLAESTP